MVKATGFLVLVLGLSATAGASTLYQFVYTPGSPFQTTTISVTEPSFLTAGTYPITGTLTDGTTTWNFTQLVIAANGANAFCFNLGTAGDTPNGCAGFGFPGGASNTSQGEIITSFFSPGGVPTANGSFSNVSQPFNGFNSSDSFTSTSGGATLTISTVTAAPEPSSVVLAAAGLLMCGLAFCRRSIRRQRI